MIKRFTPLLLTLLMLCSKFTLAQQVVPAWGGGADQRDLSFGFTFQYVSNDYKIIKNPNWQAPYPDPVTGQTLVGPLASITSKSSPGLAVGFISRYSLTEHLEVRSTPLLVFSDRSLMFGYYNANANPSSEVTKDGFLERQVQTTMVEVPLTLKLKSDRLGNFRMYVMGGLKYSAAISTKKAERDLSPEDKLIKNASHFASYEAGIGCDIYFEFFKFSPELRISNSLGNIIVPDDTPYSRPIDKLFLHSLRFSLYFE